MNSATSQRALVFGIINALYGGFGVLQGTVALVALTMIELPQISQGVLAAQKALIALNILAAVALIAGAIGLLRREDWGRRLCRGYAIYAILATLATLGINWFIVLPQQIAQVQPGMSPEQTQAVAVGTQIGSTIVSAIFGIGYPLLMALMLGKPLASTSGASDEFNPAEVPLAQPNLRPLGDNPYSAPLVAAAGPANDPDALLMAMVPTKNMPALVGYYLGLFSCFPVLGLPLAVAGIWLGIKGLRNTAREPQSRGRVHAWVALITGTIGLLINVPMVIGLVFAIIMAMQEAAKR